jgi:hypothetical protein
VKTTPTDDVDQCCREAIARAKAGQLLGPRDMMAIWRISHTTYAKMKHRGDFVRLQTQHPIGTRIYSGVLVARLLAGETIYEPTFGRGMKKVVSR